MKRAFVSAAKGAIYVMIAFVVLAATLAVTSRVLNPILNKHRGEFEQYASSFLQAPVNIDKISLSWHHFQPNLTFDQVTVLDNETKTPILQVKEISIFFSLFQSAWQRKPVPGGITVSGTDVTVYQTEKGELVIKGFSFGDTQVYSQEAKFNDVMNVLSAQPRLTLQNINIFYMGFAQKKRSLTLYHLSFENNGTDHVIVGNIVLHQDIPTEVTTTIRWTGKKFDIAQISANIYLYVSGLSLSQWFKDLSWQHWQIREGMASVKCWINWEHGAFQRIQSTFQLYNLNLYAEADKSQHLVNRLSGNIGWKLEGNQQVFAGEDLLIDLPSHLWPVSNFYVTLTKNAQGTWLPTMAKIAYVDIRDAQSFLFSWPSVLPADIKKAWTGLRPKGALQNVTIEFTGESLSALHTAVNATVNQLSVTPWQSYPGVTNLSGVLKWDGAEGEFSLHSTRLSFQYDAIFAEALPLDQLSGDIKWHREKNDSWQVNIPSLQILNHEIAANVTGTVHIGPGALPTVNLNANFTLQRADHIARYLPVKIFEMGLVNWLKHAFLAGEVRSGNAILRGSLKDFPFDKGEGEFSVSGIVHNIELNYAPDWPHLQGINGKLAFTGRTMTVDANHATISHLPISGVHAEILHLGEDVPQLLTVQSGDIAADFSQGMQFIHNSPLEKNIGMMFSGVKLTGPITLKIGLTVPLKDPDKTQVRGSLVVNNAMMDLAPWNLRINQLTGDISFTEDKIDARNMHAQLFNKPLTLNIATMKQTATTSIVRAMVNTNLNIADLQKWLRIPFSKVAQGATDVQANIDFSFGAPISIELNSKLVGIAVNLPDHYGKKASEAREMTAKIIVQDKQPLRVRIIYSDLFSAAMTLNRKKEEFNLVGATLHLGVGEADWPVGPGLYLAADFDTLDWDEMKKYTSQQTGTSSLPANLPLHSVNIFAKRLILGNEAISDVRLIGMPKNHRWDVAISGPEVVGQLDVPMSFSPKESISGQFQKLSLHSADRQTKTMPSIDVKTLPGISFVANNVSYHDMPLGQLTFKAVPENNGLTIRTLRLLSSDLDMQATGVWTQSATRLQGNAASPNVSSLLNSLRLDAHNFVGSKGLFTFSLSWNGAPYAPSLPSLNGNATLDFGKGRILDVGDSTNTKLGIGRMLSLFSLQTIPRRLSLDFSDLFQKGYSYDYIRGDFSFQNGNAYTTNTRFDGPVARVDINGRIGLKGQDFDLMLSVTPYVTSSIPVAAALITGPIGGVAALAVNTVIGATVSKVITYTYAVKGPWSDPSWQTLNHS